MLEKDLASHTNIYAFKEMIDIPYRLISDMKVLILQMSYKIPVCYTHPINPMSLANPPFKDPN